MARRVGSANAANVASRELLLYLTIWLKVTYILQEFKKKVSKFVKP
jgi:hypothetical protein